MTKSNGIVTLLTDFGTVDSYVGVMKGVMLSINPKLTLVDLTHQVPPQDVKLAAFQLQSACSYFPSGTVHLAVVDPGVGSTRRAIALSSAAGFWVGPDNGLFSALLDSEQQLSAIQLNRPQYWHNPTPSQTFHGRDIFAPVAAYLASGTPFADLGDPLDPHNLVKNSVPECQKRSNGLRGAVQAIDRFGNLITNIPGSVVQDRHWTVAIAHQQFPGQIAYSDVPWGNSVSVLGSHGWVELAIYGGNAAQQMGLGIGASVDLTWQSVSPHDLP